MTGSSEGRTNAPQRIVMTASFWGALYQHLIRVTDENPSPEEQLAFILASVSKSPLGASFLACQMIPATHSDFVYQSTGGLEPKPEFVSAAIKRCRKEGWCLIEVHSHPFDRGDRTTFSGIDWKNDCEKMPTLAAILPEPFMHATMVVGQNAVDAHFYDRETKQILPIDLIVIVGDTLQHVLTTGGNGLISSRAIDTRYHRQEMLLGHATQNELAHATIAIIGLGGLGSFVALELAHLGVGHLVLIDSDSIERTNLNRLLGAKVEDIGQKKVDVYARMIQEVSETTRVTSLPFSLTDRANTTAIEFAKGADVIFGCVDNDGARLILNQIAIRYLVPLIDGGSGIHLPDGNLPLTMGGQVQVALPGSGCLECRGYINPQRAYFDLAPENVQEEERAHGYGTDEVAPSVISLNGVIASLQVAELLFLISNSRLQGGNKPPLSIYHALKRKITPAIVHYNENCPTCGVEGVVGVGDLAPIKFAPSGPIGEPIPNIKGD